MMKLRHLLCETTACGALLLAAPAFAHHSAAMFDLKRAVTLTGTVKEFQFTNPHCFIQLVVNDEQGVSEWSIEMGAPAHLLRSGWKPRTLKPGDKITVIVNPLSDGGKGGNYASGTGPDGKSIGGPI
jgi:Family of unknown function (DUF6152)